VFYPKNLSDIKKFVAVQTGTKFISRMPSKSFDGESRDQNALSPMPSQSQDAESQDPQLNNSIMQLIENGTQNIEIHSHKGEDESQDTDEGAGFNTVEAALFHESTRIHHLHVDPEQNNELPKFYIVTDKNNRIFLKKFEFEQLDKKKQTVSADNSINRCLDFCTDKHINLYHTQLIDPCNNGFIVLVNYIYDKHDKENQIKIQLIPICRQRVSFLLN